MSGHTPGLKSQIDRRTLLKLTGFGAAGLFAAVAGNSDFRSIPSVSANDPPVGFDLDNGVAPIDVVIQSVIPVIFRDVSSFASDATIVLRLTTIITNAWFDAIAPYHETAVGVYSKIARQPETERTQHNKNVATLYASYRVLNSLLPRAKSDWDNMMLGVGLDLNDDQQATDNPVGIGNVAGLAVAAARENDGMNQLGNEGSAAHHRRPYADYTGYEPENTAYHLKRPGRWQPDIVSNGEGLFQVQQHVTPQMALTESYTGLDLSTYRAPVPAASKPGPPAYKHQVDEVLAASAAMTDHQKMTAELFDNKLLSLGFSALFIYETQDFDFHQFVEYDFLVNLAAFDMAIVIWNEKLRHDSVRPFSAIRHVYGNSPVTAWGGPGKGTVSDLPASQWRSYLQTADHSEYPSGSSGFCSAHAEASRLYLGSDELGWSVDYSAGSSRIEPQVTPSSDITLSWATWSDFESECGLSRFWSGVHFLPSIAQASPLGRRVGAEAYEFLQAHIAGDV